MCKRASVHTPLWTLCFRSTGLFPAPELLLLFSFYYSVFTPVVFNVFQFIEKWVSFLTLENIELEACVNSHKGMWVGVGGVGDLLITFLIHKKRSILYVKCKKTLKKENIKLSACTSPEGVCMYVNNCLLFNLLILCRLLNKIIIMFNY